MKPSFKEKLLKVFVLLPAILVAVFMLFVINIKADDGGTIASGTCGDNLTWVLDDNGTLTISGTGKMNDYYQPFIVDPMADDPIVIPAVPAPWYNYRNKIISVIIEPGAESIGNRAFSLCIKLQNISIPNSVQRIGDSAFKNCHSVTGIDIPSSVISIEGGAFHGCSSLTSIIIPDGITGIEDNTFSGCNSLANIDIPDSIENIGPYAFSGCKGLTYINIPSSVTSIGHDTFAGCSSLASVDIPNSVLSIGSYAFSNCSALKNIDIPNSVVSLDSSAFNGCSNLETIVVGADNSKYDSRNNCNAIIETETNTLLIGCKNTIIPDDIEVIGYRAFGGCSGLTAIDIPDNVASIGEYAFYACSSLQSIVIPNSITEIANGCFRYCSSLENIEIPDSVELIGDEAFEDCSNLSNIVIPEGLTSIGTYAFRACGSLKSIIIPNSVTSIGSSLFSGCTSLTSIDISENITSIGAYTFGGCSSLASIEIPNSVTSIGHYAFSSCRSLTSIEIPNSVTRIGEYAFSGCNSLIHIDIPESVTSINSGLFSNCTNLTSIEIPNNVTIIANDVFNGCVSLADIELPDGVTSIGSDAFRGCISLTNINIPYNVTVLESNLFNGCIGLTDIEILDSVTSIGGYAFCGCKRLTHIEIPDSVISIDNNAFDGCSSLTSINIPSGVTSIAYNTFDGCSSLMNLFIPSNVTSIDGSAFNGCSGLETITVDEGNTVYDSRDYCNAIIETDTNTLIAGCKNTIIPHDIEIIGASAFDGCSGLTDIDIPYGVKIISYAAFKGCSGLTSIEIPETVETIGTYAYAGCSGFTELVIPFNVTSLDGSSFSGCSGLESISVDLANPVYDSRNDCNAIIESETDALIQGCNNTVIPDDVKSIGEYAFDGITGLTNIEIPGNVSSIGSYAFSDCCDLETIIIAVGVENIGAGAFSGCSNLTSVAIPNSVTSINYGAFSGCCSLMSIMLSDSLTSIRRSIFEDCSIADVYYRGTEDDWEDKFYADGGLLMNYHIANLFTSEDLDTSLYTDISLTNVPGGVAVTISGAGSFRYTLDGSIPCSISAPYEGTFILETPGEYFINARAFDLENGTYGQITTEHIIIGQSAKPVISERGGQVIISGDGDIYYSLDITSDPSIDSYQYAGPLRFDKTTVIKARCIEAGKAASEVVGYTFYVSTGSGLEFPAETYSFNNTKQSFGYKGFFYKIPEERYTEIFGNSVGKMLYDIYGSDAWSGSCFGMAATSILFHKGMLNLRDYSDAAENVNSLLAPASPDSMLTKLIERYQISQFLPEVMKERGDVTEGGNMVISNLSGNTEDAETLLDAVRRGLAGGDPVILIVWRQDLAGSHAVVPYKVENGRIYVYDCNDPGTEKYISYSMNANEIYSFRFGDYSYAVSYNRFSMLMSGLESSVDIGNAILQSDDETSRMLISIDSKNVSILDVNGREITKRISYHATEDMETSNTVLCLNTGAYRIVNHDSSRNSLTVSAATDDDYQKLTVQDPNAEIEVQEKNGKVYICVRSDHDAAIESYIMSGAGFTNSVSLTSSFVEIYSVAARAVSVRTTASAITVNGITEEIKDEESAGDINSGSAMNRDFENGARLYSENDKYSLSTDITQLPGEDFNLTVFTTGGDENVMLYIVSYNANGQQIGIKGTKMTAGRTRYAFSISKNAAAVKVYMLTADGGIPVIGNLCITK